MRYNAPLTEQYSLNYALGAYGRYLKNLESDQLTHRGEIETLAQVFQCVQCSSLWTHADSHICNPIYASSNLNDTALATAFRNRGNLLAPSQDLYNFGEWVVARFLHILKLSYIRLPPVPEMIQTVINTYNNNRYNPPKLPSCHPIAQFIIKKLGHRILAVFCSRLSMTEKERASHRENPSIPSAVRVWKY